MKALLRIIILIFVFSSSGTQAYQDTETLKIYVEQLINKSTIIFNDSTLSHSEKNIQANNLIGSHLHLE